MAHNARTTRPPFRFQAPTILVAASLLLNGQVVGRGARIAHDSAGYLAGAQALLAEALTGGLTGLLALARMAAERAHVRPVYSMAHNALIKLMVAVIYPLAAAGCRLGRTERLAQLMLATIVTQLLIVCITGADWDGRYILFVFPLVLGFAGCGIASKQAKLVRRLAVPRADRSGLLRA